MVVNVHLGSELLLHDAMHLTVCWVHDVTASCRQVACLLLSLCLLLFARILHQTLHHGCLVIIVVLRAVKVTTKCAILQLVRGSVRIALRCWVEN